MQIRELLTESYIHRDIPKLLKAKGYQGFDDSNEFSKGIDQLVALEPNTGMILKIFGTSKETISRNTLSKGQRAWLAFSEYCIKHSNNPFLPQFQGWETFEYKGKTYLQIRSERLFPLADDGAHRIKMGLAHMAYVIKNDGSYNSTINILKNMYPELLMHLDKKDFDLLYKTIRDLKNIADRIDAELDLDYNADNFMQTSDGQLVINDPFYSYSN